MSGLRLETDFAKIGFNARELVARAAARNISVTGVTKAMMGDPRLAEVLLDAGVASLGDARIANVETMIGGGVDAPMVLIRSPLPSEISRVVRSGVTSCNTELDVMSLLSSEARAAGRTHNVIVMVELGDLREGVMPDRLPDLIGDVLRLGNIHLSGLGANLACRNGVEPDAVNMATLSSLVARLEQTHGIEFDTVSGGSSANLAWALGPGEPWRVNNLRLGESILLGREPLHRQPIPGLHTDAIHLVGEVIESIRKPSKPWGRIAQAAFGDPEPVADRGPIWQTILGLGHQDTDPAGLTPPSGIHILGASSDHLIVESHDRLRPGTELRFEPNYSALLRATTSPHVGSVSVSGSGPVTVGPMTRPDGYAVPSTV